MSQTPRSFLATNLKCLEFVDPEVAERISKASAATVAVAPSSSGAPTASAKTFDGVEAHLHSKENPTVEARRFVAGLKTDTEAVAVIGLGLGYHLIELARAMPKERWLLVVEAREDIARAAFEAVDLSEVLGRPRTRVFVGNDYVAFLEWLKTFLNDSNAETLAVVRHPASYRFDPGYYRQLHLEMQSAVTRRSVEVATLIQYAGLLEENAIRNLPHSFDAASVSDFRGIFAGKPAILVAAGPSLGPALPLLEGVGDRAVVVSVDKCAKLLAARGVRAHVTSLLDMTDATRAFYEGFRPDPMPALFYDPDSYHGSVEAYPGPRITFETVVPWTRWLSRLGGPTGVLEKGISVAHTAYLFLRETGADPIILVGVDLAFPGDRTHAEGVVMNWGGAVTPDMPHQVDVPCVKGGTVRSVIAFKTFVTVFEILISQTEAKVVNTSPDGALIRGAANLPLADAIARHAAEPFDPGGLIGGVFAKRRKPDWPTFRAAAGRVLDRTRAVLREAEAGAQLGRRLRRLDLTNRLDREEYGRRGRRVNAHRLAILREMEVLPLLQRLMSGDALTLKKINQQLATTKDPKEAAKLEMDRLETFFKAYLDATKHVEKHLAAVLQSVEGR